MAKRSSDPRVAYPEVKVQVRDLVPVLCIVPPFASRAGAVFGENSFYRAPGYKLALETCAGCHQQRYTTGSLVGTGPAGSVFGENSFYRQTRGTN